MGKKRKAEVDLDAERTLYSSFVSAANTVSQLYTQAVQQQRKIGAAAARQSLERIMCTILKEYQHAEMIPKSVLLQYLQQEYEYADGSEHAPQRFPAQFLPPVIQGGASSPHTCEHHDVSHKSSASAPRGPAPVTSSPGRRGTPLPGAPAPATAAAMDTAEHYSGMDTSHGPGTASQGLAGPASFTFAPTEGPKYAGPHGFGSFS